MAIGLDDLKKFKKRRQEKRETAAAPAKNELRMPSRPWSNRGLHKAASFRETNADFHMNEEWLTTQSHLVADISFETEQRTQGSGLQLQNLLATLEQNILSSTDKVKNIWSFLTAKKS